jgi:hypothetical protein
MIFFLVAFVGFQAATTCVVTGLAPSMQGTCQPVKPALYGKPAGRGAQTLRGPAGVRTNCALQAWTGFHAVFD